MNRWVPRRARFHILGSKAIVAIPRAGSTTMAMTCDSRFTGFHQSNDVADLEGLEVFAWIRNPYERLASTHRLFYSLTGEEFGDRVLRNPDIHMTPQLELIPAGATLLKFEDINTTFSQHFPGVLMERTRERPQAPKRQWIDIAADMPAEMVAAIDAKFADDYAAWSAL